VELASSLITDSGGGVVAIQSLTISYLAPDRADILAHLALLKPAFNGSDEPKAEWEEMRDDVLAKDASLYLIKAKGVHIRMAGRLIDGVYHVICSQGRGLIHAAPIVIEKCQLMGYPAITYHAYRQGMGRLLRRLGFELDCVLSAKESRYILKLGGHHG